MSRAGRSGLIRPITAGAFLFAAGMLLASATVRSPIQERMPAGGASRGHDLLAILPPTLIPVYAAILGLPCFVLLARRRPLGRRAGIVTLACWVAAVLGITIVAELFVAWMTSRASGGPVELWYFLSVRSLGTLPIVAGAAALGQMIVMRQREAVAAREVIEARALASEAQLGALMDHLRPHFLFNTLQSVSTLIHRDPAAADAVLGSLADLLRASVLHRDTRSVPVREEYRMIGQFLDIAQVRFGDRLRTEMDVSPEAAHAGVPPFLMQPLVENSIRHGLEQRGGDGCILVSAHREASALVLEVRDDGTGWVAGAPEGTGLRSVRERLRILYGEQASLTMFAQEPHGTVARVRLPFEDAIR